jgi:hypothetical protein
MSKKSKRKIPTKTKRRAERQERRFVSQTASSPMLVRALGAVAALVLGAGAWAYVYGKSFAFDESMKQVPSYLIAGGAVVLGIAIWFGTSSEPPIRVGDPGIAQEKGELRRMSWWAIDKITFDSAALALVIAGRDEASTDWTFKVPMKSHPEAAGWILREALDRISRRVDIDDTTLEKLPGAGEHAGQKLALEALQVVGKRCAATGKTISYEPDATVCPRCERVYLKTAVPKKCKCGYVMSRSKDADEGDADTDTDRDDDVRRDDDETSEARATAQG